MSTGMSSGFKGTGLRPVQISKMSPQKKGYYDQVMGTAGPAMAQSAQRMAQLASGGTPETWEQLEAPAMRQFGQLQGNIASRFSGGGGQGGGQAAGSLRHSSGFQNEMGEQAADLAERLQGQRLDYMNNASEQLRSLYHDLMSQDEYDTFITNKKKKQKWWQKAAGVALPIGGAIAGGFAGGPAGASMGYTAGRSFGNAISGDGDTGMNFTGVKNLPKNWDFSSWGT